MPKSSILNQRCEQYKSLHEHYVLSKTSQLKTRWKTSGEKGKGREGQGEEKGECEAGEKGYKRMREIGKGHIGEEKVGWKER